jgi:hypothetical protein
VQLKILDYVSLGVAKGLTAQITVQFRVCCVQKGEAQFVYICTVDKTILCRMDGQKIFHIDFIELFRAENC